MTLRKCKCGKEAIKEDELDLFVKSNNCLYGRRNQCKACGSNATRKSLGYGPKKSAPKGTYLDSKGQTRWQRYKVSESEYQEMLKKADNRCQICGDTYRLVIDHCHDTNIVRGILCHSCNIGLGFFRDNHERLSSASVYLLRTSQLH